MRSTRVVFGALIVGALLPLASAQAQPHIGGAIVARNDVRGQTQGRTQKIAEGDRVFQNQVVRTGADSLAKLVLLDETNVAVGPSSQVTLDRFVYDPQVGAKQVAIGAAAGAFRFISGRAPHEAYEVRTPQAIIGVRGTTYDVLVEAGRTRVVLQEGAVRVCRHAGVICIELTEPGQSAEVTDNGITGPIDPAQKTWDFGSLCGGAVDPCARVTQFALNDRPQPRRRAATATPQPRRAAVASARPPMVAGPTAQTPWTASCTTGMPRRAAITPTSTVPSSRSEPGAGTQTSPRHSPSGLGDQPVRSATCSGTTPSSDVRIMSEP